MPEQEDQKDSKDYSHLRFVINRAWDAIGMVSDAYNQPWTKEPSTGIRAVFGHWLVRSVRHLSSIITLCETHDLSLVASVHHRQIFEIYLQVKFFSLHNQDKQNYLAEKISVIGCVDFLVKLEKVKNRKDVKKGYTEVQNILSLHDEKIIEEIKQKRNKNIYNWFEMSFSKLASDVSEDGEDLSKVYQIISSEAHGTWGLAFDVINPEPGKLDFKGYIDQNDLYRRASDILDQATILYVNLWNVIADSVGARQVFL